MDELNATSLIFIDEINRIKEHFNYVGLDPYQRYRIAAEVQRNIVLHHLIKDTQPAKSVSKGQFKAEVQAMIDTLSRIRRDAEAVPQLVHALRDLHDLQNGPPLERDREDWDEVMARVAELLKKYETE